MSVNVYDPVNDELIPVAGATLFAEMPLGAIQAFDSTDIPSNFLEFKGQTVNRADYPDLWAHIVKNSLFGEGKLYGVGDGSTTFTLADLRETSLKGYGETSRSVGAHVKSGGLGIGEFIDDRIQNHIHDMPNSLTDGANGYYRTGGDIFNGTATTNVNNARKGPTTEVKAVGVVWAVKAKQTGLPIDLQQQMENYVAQLLAPVNVEGVVSEAGDNKTLAVVKSGKVVTVNAFIVVTTAVGADEVILRNLPLPAANTVKDFLAKDWNSNTVYNIYISADNTLKTRQGIPQGIVLFFGITYICQ